MPRPLGPARVEACQRARVWSKGAGRRPCDGIIPPAQRNQYRGLRRKQAAAQSLIAVD